MLPKAGVFGFNWLNVWYTPGVSKPCLDIRDHPEKVYEHTNKWNTVAVVSDGTRVLGMGDIGPTAGMPVMEGKSLLYKYLGGVDGFPLMVGSKDPEDIIKVVKLLQPGLGGVNLEDISNPKCFYILDTLRAECEIPVWHDDQQGTACVTLAGLINALKVVGKKIDEARIVFIGAGASNVAISRLIFSYGATPALCRVVDSKGILNKARADIEARKADYVDKWKLCNITNAEGRSGEIAEALVGLGFASIFPTTLAQAGAVFSEYSGTAFSVIFVMALSGGMSAPWLVGRIAQNHGVGTGFWVTASSCAAITILQILIRLRNRRVG